MVEQGGFGVICSASEMMRGHSGSSGMAVERSLIVFKDVSYKCDVGLSGCRVSGCCRKKRKQVLFDLSGILKPGLNAIMGSSGSGKSTLLNVLAGRIDSKGLTGTVSFDGEFLNNNSWVSTGYVLQNDQIVGTLTVRENLWFAANLRLSSNVSRYEKRVRVENVISQLGLTSCASSKIGTEHLRGISGGERKRACIGMELIIRPSILFLDEPTGGLDASTAYTVMLLLKRLACQGHNIVVSIHQPRYSMFRLFDTLTLLGRGRMLYHGDLLHVLPYFREIGYDCDLHENPSDYLLDVLTGDVDIEFGNIQLNKENLSEEQMTFHVHRLATLFKSSSVYASGHRKIEMQLGLMVTKTKKTHLKPGPLTSVFYQFWILSQRAFKNLLRNPLGLISNIILNLIIGVLFGLLYFQMDMSVEAGRQNRFGILFFVSSNLMFGSFGAIEMFVKERAMFLHEHASRYYRVSCYFSAKLMADLLPLRTISPVIFSSVTYWMVGLKATTEAFFTYLLTILLLVYAAVGIGMFYSAIFSDFTTSSAFIALTFVFSILFNGLLINVDTVLPWLAWMKHFSIARYAYTALCINEFGNQDFHSCPGNKSDMALVEISGDSENMTGSEACVFTSGDEFVEASLAVKLDADGKLSSWQLWENLGALGSIALAMFLLTYIRLVRMSARK